MSFLDEQINQNTPSKRNIHFNTQVTSVSLPNDLIEQMNRICNAKEITRSKLIRIAIEGFIERANESGFIYFIQFGDPDNNGIYKIKIGRTDDINRRLSELVGATHNLPVELKMLHHIRCNYVKLAEKALHDIYKPKRRAGTEYFDLREEDLHDIYKDKYLEIPKIRKLIKG